MKLPVLNIAVGESIHMMKNFQTSFARTKLSTFPNPSHLTENDEGEIQDAKLQSKQKDSILDDKFSSESSISSINTLRSDSYLKLAVRPNGPVSAGKSAPIPWTSFFEREIFIKFETESASITYHAYFTPHVGSSPLFVMHHGAGSSGLSFAILAKEIRMRLPSAGILSVDARGHGETSVIPEQKNLDLSLSTLTEDLLSIINKTKVMLNWEELPSLVLLGHSLGGAVITDIAKSGRLGDSLLCYAVLDVVEGSAMNALKSMQNYLLARPVSFLSLESAIEWHIRTRTIRNATSARTSVPSLVKQTYDSDVWTWRTDLSVTEPFWESWFKGMSQKFLEGKAGKLLLLAGTDRLDTTLMIGQMQEAGHFIHEDLPAKTAMVIVDFYHRNNRSTFVLPPKVADMLREGKKV